MERGPFSGRCTACVQLVLALGSVSALALAQPAPATTPATVEAGQPEPAVAPPEAPVASPSTTHEPSSSSAAPPASAAQPAPPAPAPASAPTPSTASAPAPSPDPSDPTAVILPPEHQPRKGLYGRAVVGLGVTDFQLGPYLSSRAVSLSVSGAVGYALDPSFILGLELFTALAPKSGLYFDVNGEWTNDTRAGIAGFGPTVIVYLPSNFHASLTWGTTQHSLDADLPGITTFSARSQWGVGGQLTLGRDFELSPPIWFGPAMTLYYSRNQGDRYYDHRQVTTWGGALGASFSFQ